MIFQQLSIEDGGIMIIRYTIVNDTDRKGNPKLSIQEEPICLFRITKLKKAS